MNRSGKITLIAIVGAVIVAIVLIVVSINGASEDKQGTAVGSAENNAVENSSGIDETHENGSEPQISDSLREIQIPQTAGYGNTAGNLSNGGFTAIQGDWIYFVSDDDGKIYAVKTDGSGLRKINDDRSSDINIVGDWILYHSSDGGSFGNIYAVKTDGSERQVILDNPNIIDVVVVDNWIYYLDGTNYRGSLNAIKTDGSGFREISDNYVISMFVDGDTIYYRDENAILYAINTDGSGKRTVGDEVESPSFILDDWLYYTTGTVGDSIWAIKADGSEKHKLDKAKCFMGGINTDGEWIYYRNDDDKDNIYAIKPDGSENRKVTTIDGLYYSISIVGEWIYYENITGMLGDAPFYQMYAIKTDGTERRLVGYDGIKIGMINSQKAEVEIWKNPDANSELAGFLRNKTEVAIRGETNGFYSIGQRLTGEDSYISKEFVDIIGDQ